MAKSKSPPLFEVAPTEIRAALTSASRLPLPDSTRLAPDEMVRMTVVGNVKGCKSERGPGGTYVSTYAIEVISLTLEE